MRQPGKLMNLVIVIAFTSAISACMPAPPVDDNGDLAFIRQAIPKILGRKAKGSDEIEVLQGVNLLLGREAVVRMLMEQPEFIPYWTNVFVDSLRMQRAGDRAQFPACFGDPMRASVSASLATFVRANPPNSTAPGGAFNMIDLIASSIAADDLSPFLKAYPIPLTTRVPFGSPDQQRLAVGDAFNHAMLNHQIDCFGCHSSDGSVTNGVGWDRTFAIPLQLEAAVYGSNYTDPGDTKAKTYGVFRGDQLSGTTVAPWGIANACGAIRTNLVGLPAIDSFFAGAMGTQLGLIDVVTKFKTGSDALKATGVSRTTVPDQNPTVPGDQAFAYMVAASVAENVWEQLLGEKLTIANYYPRNPDQRGALWNVTEFVFIPSGFSLKDLIARIMTGKFFNRTAPDIGGGTTPYRMQMIFDPWVAKDQRLPDPTPDPKEHNNGQGELVHRYSPDSLFRSVAAALDWPGPKRFPDGSYPSNTLVKAMGQFSSDAEQGTRGVDFQGLLTWESQHGVCQKPAGVTTDWVDRLVTSMPAFDAANPGFPLTVADLVETMKDWLVGEQTISSVAPVSPDPMVPVLSEQAALFALFGVPLNSTAASVPSLQSKLRKYCGTLLQSPRFLLAGLEPTTGLAAPRHRICNGAPCTFVEICTAYQATLATMGHYIDCANHVVLLGQPPQPSPVRCGLDCIQVSSRAALFCERNPLACVIPAFPPGFPEPPICGSQGCPPPWSDIRNPTLIVMPAGGAAVTLAQNASIKPLTDGTYRALKVGETLRGGDVLRLPPGAVLEAKAGDRVFATPRNGIPSRFGGKLRPIDSELLDAAGRATHSISVEALLDKRANVNARDRFGETPLMKAVAAGDLGTIELLLKRGADPTAQDTRGFTAADIAAVRKQANVVDFLAKRGLAAKGDNELAAPRAPVEEAWIVLVAGEGTPPGAGQARMTPSTAWELTEKGVLGTKGRDINDIQKQRETNKFVGRGQGGTLPRTAKDAAEAIRLYMERDFAREHKALTPAK